MYLNMFMKSSEFETSAVVIRLFNEMKVFKVFLVISFQNLQVFLFWCVDIHRIKL